MISLPGCIVAQLQLKTGESANLTVLAEKVATSFENIFDERSLENGVSYLKVWSLEQRGKENLLLIVYIPLD